MFSLKYNTLDERTPKHQSKICYYILNDTYNLPRDIFQHFSEVTYGWYSSCAEVQEHYDEVLHKDYNIMDTKQWVYYDEKEDEESHKTVRLLIELDGQPIWYYKDQPEENAEIAWNYTHDIVWAVKVQQNEDYFPSFDINNLLREGYISIIDFDKVSVGEEGNEYFQIYGTLKYKDGLYKVRMAQDGYWLEDCWVKQKDGTVPLGKVDLFSWKKLL